MRNLKESLSRNKPCALVPGELVGASKRPTTGPIAKRQGFQVLLLVGNSSITFCYSLLLQISFWIATFSPGATLSFRNYGTCCFRVDVVATFASARFAMCIASCQCRQTGYIIITTRRSIHWRAFLWVVETRAALTNCKYGYLP